MTVLAASPAWPASAVTYEAVTASLPKLDELARTALQRTGVPGMAIGVVYADKVVYLKGFGVREIGKPDPVDEDTVFQVASLSKPIAATVVAALVGEGVVSWDDPVVKHDPGFQMYDPWVTRQVTLRDMFSHRSGLPAYAGDRLEDMGYDRDAVLFRLRYQLPASSLRSKYAYTNFGLTEAAVAAAKAAGKPWEEIAEEKLYRPLGMASTSSRYADFISRQDRAVGHVKRDGKWIVSPEPRQPDAQSPAGGVSASVRDMVQWVRLQLDGGKLDGKDIIAAGALDETHRPQFISNPPANPTTDTAGFYGLGWNVGYEDGRVRLSHSGAFGLGAGTTVTLLPGEQLGIVVLTNGAPIGLAEAVAKGFFDLVLTGGLEKDWVGRYQTLFAEFFKPDYGSLDRGTAPASPQPALPPAAYIGTYQNDLLGPVEVAESEGGLVLKEGPRQTEFRLTHFDRDTFSYQPKGENAYGRSAVTFLIGPDAMATAVRIENLDVNGQGTFVKKTTAGTEKSP